MSDKRDEFLTEIYLLERNNNALLRFLQIIPMSNLFENELQYIKGVLKNNNIVIHRLEKKHEKKKKNDKKKEQKIIF